MTSVIDLRIDVFTRDGVDILRDIRWEVAEGEHWTVLGPNGAGKSSLLSIVAGYEWPSRGEVAVLGQQYGHCDMRALKERIGWVSSALFSWLPARQSARQVAATGIHATIGNWHALSASDLIRADDALGRIGAYAFRNKPYGVLSQGEKQRVMIARALVQQPSVLLLDEPTSHLDIRNQLRIYRMLVRLASEWGMAVVCVSHDINLATRFADDLVLMREGGVVASGGPDDVLRANVLRETYGVDVRLIPVEGQNTPAVWAE